MHPNPTSANREAATTTLSSLAWLRRDDAAILIVVLVLAGYPLLGTLIAMTLLPSLVASVPVRAMVIMLSLMLLLSMNRRRWRQPGNLLILTFWLVYVARLLWDMLFAQIPIANIYLFNFVFFCIVPATALMHAPAFDERRLVRLLLPACMLTCVFALIAGNTDLTGVRSYTDDNEGRLFLETVNPITFGQIGVTTVLMALCWSRSCRRWSDWLAVAAAVLLGVSTISIAASRGPLVSLSICLLVLALFYRPFRWMLMPIAVLVFFLVSSDFSDSSNLLLSRIDFTKQSDHSEERMLIQASAINQFHGSPLFGSAIVEPLSGNYPHNLFIEVAMATGVVGLALIAWIVVTLLRKCTHRIRVSLLPLALLMIQHLVDSQFSGNLSASAPLWILLTLVTSTPIRIDKSLSVRNKVSR